jgi:hypothetical protein
MQTEQRFGRQGILTLTLENTKFKNNVSPSGAILAMQVGELANTHN